MGIFVHIARLLAWILRIGSHLTRVLRTFRATTFGKWLWFHLFLYMGGLIGKMLWLLGVTLVANQFATPVFTGLIAGSLMGLPSEWVSFIGLTKLDQGITIILSAVAIRTVDQIRVQRRRDAWQQPL